MVLLKLFFLWSFPEMLQGGSCPSETAIGLLTLWARDEKIIRGKNEKSWLSEQTKSPSPSLKIVFLTSCLCICFSYPLCLQLMTQFFLFPVLGNQRRWVWVDWSQSLPASGTRKGFMAETNFPSSSSPFHAGKRSCKNGNKRSEKPLEAKGTWSFVLFLFFPSPPSPPLLKNIRHTWPQKALCDQWSAVWCRVVNTLQNALPAVLDFSHCYKYSQTKPKIH